MWSTRTGPCTPTRGAGGGASGRRDGRHLHGRRARRPDNWGFSVVGRWQPERRSRERTCQLHGQRQLHQGRRGGQGRSGRRRRQLRRVPGNGRRCQCTWTNPVTTLSDWTQDTSKFDFALGDPFDVDSQKTLADVNGDGLPDRVQVTRTGVYVRFGLGYGFTRTWEPWARSLAFEQSESLSGSMNAFGGRAGVWSARWSSSRPGSRRARRPTSPAGPGTTSTATASSTRSTRTADGVKVRFGTGTACPRPPATAPRRSGNGQFLASGARLFGSSDQSGEQIRQDSAISVGGGLDLSPSGSRCAPAACYLIISPGGHAAAT